MHLYQILINYIDEMSFWTRNEGQLIGTAGGVLIAILAAFLTYYLSNKQANKKEKEAMKKEMKKEKDAYQGMLYVLHVELYWQNHQLDMLKNTLEKLKITSLEEKEFVIENPPTMFNFSIVEKCLDKIIEYKDYKHELIVLVVSYINQIKDLNYILDFRNARKLMSKIVNDKTFDIEKQIEIYFNTFNIEYIDKAKPNISMIRNIIEKELEDYPSEKMIFKESDKTIKINNLTNK